MPKILGISHNTYDSNTTTVQENGSIRIKKRFSLTYDILSDNTTQTEVDIEATPGLPPLLSPIAGCLVRGYRSKEETEVIKHPATGVPCSLWKTEVFLDNDLDPLNVNNDPDTPPESRRPKVAWGYETEEEVMVKDPITGDPIQTFAGEPIILTQPVTIATLTIKRFEPYPFNPVKIYEFGNHTNANPFWGAPSGSAYMMPMTTQEAEMSWGTGDNIQTALFDEVTYTIKFRMKRVEGGGDFVQNTWMYEPLHQGYYYIPDDVDPGPLTYAERRLRSKLYLDPESGSPKMVNLQLNGRILKTGDPVYLFFNRVPQADFDILGLGPFL